MIDSFKTEKEHEIWNFIKKLNEYWINGQPEKLSNFFHKDMVILTSDFKEQGKGREICVNSYVSFVKQAKTVDF